MVLALNELGKAVPRAESSQGFLAALPSTRSFVNRVTLDTNGVAAIDFNDRFPAVSAAGAGAVALDALSRTVFQFAGVKSISFSVNGSCDAFWSRLGGEGCFQFVGPSEIAELDSSVSIAASFPETIFPNEPMGFTDFYPSPANTRRVILSKACHDGNDGVSGGPCIDNTGCSSYSENNGSANIANEAVNGLAHGVPGFNNLLQRQFTVRIAQGTARNNIARSNTFAQSWSTAVHVPIHSNAIGSGTCSSTSGGTQGLYNNKTSTYGKPSTAGRELTDLFWQTTVGVASPGANDQRVLRNDLGELKPANVKRWLPISNQNFTRGQQAETSLSTIQTGRGRLGMPSTLALASRDGQQCRFPT